MNPVAGPIGTITVLDIESAPDPAAAALAGGGDPLRRGALHRLRAFSALTATESADGWHVNRLRSAAHDDELPLLRAIDEEAAALAAANGCLVTYNGLSHDVDVITRRAMASWAFDLRGIAALPGLPHVDLLRRADPRAGRPRGGHGPSLRDACAALRIPTDHLLASRTREPPALAIRKSQTDVAATFLLLLHDVAMARGTAAPLIAGWTALIAFLDRERLRDPHLAQFRHHPMLMAAMGGR